MGYIRIYLIERDLLDRYDQAYQALRAAPSADAWRTFAETMKVPYVSRADIERRTLEGDWDSDRVRADMRDLIVAKHSSISISDDIVSDLRKPDSAFVAGIADLPESPVQSAVNTLIRQLLLDPNQPNSRCAGPFGLEQAPSALLTPPEVEILQRQRDYIIRMTDALDSAPLAVRLMRSDLKKLADQLAKLKAPYPHLFSVLV